MRTFFLLMFIVSIIGINYAQTDYYVDSVLGKDTVTNGTSPDSSAFKTLQYAVNNVLNPTSDSIVIHIAPGLYNLSNNQLKINRNFINLTLIGDSTISTVIEADSDTTSSLSRVIRVYVGNKVYLKYLTIQNGRSATSGGGIYVDSSGVANIDHCIIMNNIGGSTGIGGGIGSYYGVLTLSNSTVKNNVGLADCYGGGIGILNGIVNITNSTVNNNQSSSGGGIAAISSYGDVILNMTNCTVASNLSTYGIGGIRLDKYAVDTSVYVDTFYVSANLNSCTVFDNTCTGPNGIGGIGVWHNNLNVNLNIKNSIVSGNIATVDSAHSDLNGPTISGDYNLIQNTYTSEITGNVSHNIYGLSAYCQPLALNNSLNGTMTCAIPDSSPAKDQIPVASSNGAPLLDQRGATRNGNFDIGSYEFWTNNGDLPVELSSFMASFNGNNVELKWTTASEINNRGFQIEKNSGSGFLPLTFVSGHGTSTQLNKYSYVDKNVSAGNYSYRLKQIDFDGSFKYSNVIEINVGGPNKFELDQNYPNPFNPTTTIKFALPKTERVRIIIYNMIGQEVSQITDRDYEAGNHSVQFNGSNFASGVYFYKIQAGTFSQVKKMILMK